MRPHHHIISYESYFCAYSRHPPVHSWKRHPIELRCNVGKEHGSLGQDHQPAVSGEDHVRGHRAEEELPEQGAFRIPDLQMHTRFELAWSLSSYLRCVTRLYSVSTSGVDVACGIELNAVGNAGVHICEHPAIRECAALGVDVERIAIEQGSARRLETAVVVFSLTSWPAGSGCYRGNLRSTQCRCYSA